MQGEFGLIEQLKSLIPPSLQGPFSIGDDAAILPNSSQKSLLFSTDVIVEGVDFLLGKKGARPEQIGHKALAVNLSDMAAMGARPVAFIAAIGIPKNFAQKSVERVAKGMISLAKKFKIKWVGGDITRSDKFFISIAILGEQNPKKIVKRSGAKLGDLIFVTGDLGGSILGKHLSFTPRVREALYLAEKFRPSAMIDLSDGLIQDLGHVLASSKKGAKVELAKIPISNAARKKSGENTRKALEYALTDGEDFELLFTLSKKQAKNLEQRWRKNFPHVRLTQIGALDSHAGEMEWQEKGKRTKLWFQKKGYSHF